MCETVPPKYDVEIWNEHANSNDEPMLRFYNKEYEKFASNLKHRFIVLGLSKGTVIFLPIDQIDLIYARFSFHRQAVTHLHEIHGANKFISICDELSFCVWGFENHRSRIYNQCSMLRPVSKMISFSKHVLIAFQSSDLQLFQFNDN